MATITSSAPTIPVTTYTGQGAPETNTLLWQMVRDLSGNGTPLFGVPKANHMKIVYVNDNSIDFTNYNSVDATKNYTIVLESTTNMDPFARSDVTVDDPATDPWRIVFQTFEWLPYELYSAGQNGRTGTWTAWDANIKVKSMGVYLGTPATIRVGDPGNPGSASANVHIAYDQVTLTTGNAASLTPPWFAHALINGQTDGQLAFGTDYISGAPRLYTEPVGNTGAPWSNPWDPLDSTKIQGAPATSAPGVSVHTPAGPNGVTAVTSGATLYGDGPDVYNRGELFVNRWNYKSKVSGLFGTNPVDDATAQEASPMSYRIVLTDHGLFLSVWGENPEELALGFSWLLVQRSVDKSTGIVRGVLPGFPHGDPANTGNRPLFCVNSTDNQFYKFIVREHDLPIPSTRKQADVNSLDSGAVINSTQQLSLTENGEYVISFINNLNTSRFKYADELDMLGTVGADVVGGGQEIDVAVYNEYLNINGSNSPVKRTYHALWPSGVNGTDMRIMVIKELPANNKYS